MGWGEVKPSPRLPIEKKDRPSFSQLLRPWGRIQPKPRQVNPNTGKIETSEVTKDSVDIPDAKKQKPSPSKKEGWQ